MVYLSTYTSRFSKLSIAHFYNLCAPDLIVAYSGTVDFLCEMMRHIISGLFMLDSFFFNTQLRVNAQIQNGPVLNSLLLKSQSE